MNTTNLCFMNKWNTLPAKAKKWLRESDIFVHMLNFLTDMFTYEGLSETVNTDFIEFYNILNPYASSGVFEYNGNEYVGYVTQGGFIDPYGIPNQFNINTLSEAHKENVIDGGNGAICWNNSTHTSDLVKLMQYTELFNLCDTSQKCLLRYARLFPVYEVENQQVLDQLKTALENADNGEPFTYKTRGLTRISTDNEPSLKITHLGDFTAVDKLQNLSTYYNDLLRRFYSMYGMSYSQSMKQAQQSIEEIHSDTIVSWIVPLDRLEERKKFIEKYNTVFGRKATVDFSDAWKRAYEKYMISERGVENGKEVL